MHGLDPIDSGSSSSDSFSGPWYKELTRYHWYVLIVAALGWLFDTMDQQLFVLARVPALTELMTVDGVKPDITMVSEKSGLVTAIFLIGWASGGLAFGALGDRIGRAKTMVLTILAYSLFTGLSALSVGFWDFAFYRFLTGLGVGGEFAVGVSLVAEVMPDRARPFALGLLQALSAIGNISAAFISMGLGKLEQEGIFTSWVVAGVAVKAWRLMFIVGILPALLAVVIRRSLKEPERWQKVAAEGETKKRAGSYAELFSHPTWRKHAIFGMLLAFAGVVGLWGVGFFTFDLFGIVLKESFEKQGLAPEEVSGNVTFWKGMASLMINIGAFFGIYAFAYITHFTGRKPAFAVAFTAALVSTVSVFWFLESFSQMFWMVPIMGFCQLALFGGYAIYFPELFPTHLRSTGTSFCYNVGRFVAAVGPYGLGMLASKVYGSYATIDPSLPLRYAGVTMCSVFLLGLVVLPFLPETKGKPLPE
ncbi:MAG: MFS transporter [Planctomycetota bacterium]|nr:MFS transporter [Planctomycetota bacterium]MDA1213857.1 MFS transporter [Planctomycetota bacterium]